MSQQRASTQLIVIIIIIMFAVVTDCRLIRQLRDGRENKKTVAKPHLVWLQQFFLGYLLISLRCHLYYVFEKGLRATPVEDTPCKKDETGGER